MKKPVGILWNLSAFNRELATRPPEAIYRSVGENTGNMAFVDGIRRIIGEEAPIYGWMHDADFLNEHCSALVFPAANQLGPHTDLGELADHFKKLKIPMVALGLGAQAEIGENNVVLKPGTRRWLDVLMDMAPSTSPHVSVRGEFTRSFLESLGYGDKVVAAGCPSQFISVAPRLGQRLAAKSHYPLLNRLAVTSSHQAWLFLQEFENELVAYMEARGGTYVVQSPLIMVRVGLADESVLKEPEFSEVHRFLRPDLSLSAFFDWCRRFVFAFADVPSWMHHLSRHDFVAGSRIHGVMLGLQQGVPGYLIAYDSRTLELAQAMCVPHATPKEVKGSVVEHAKRQLCNFDYSSFDARRAHNAKVHFDLLTQCGLSFQSDYLRPLLPA